MTYEEIETMISKIGFPSAYHHFAERESPPLPFLIYYSLGENTFGADDGRYHSFKRLNIELYTNVKSPEREDKIEKVLELYNIYYTKSEIWIDSEKMFEVLYELEV